MKLRAFLYALAGVAWLAIPLIVLAQTTGGATSGNLVPCAGAADCNLCTFGQLIQNVINYVIGLSIPLAAILFAWAGWLYFSNHEDTSRIAQAHRIFTTVFIGFVIAVSAWLIVQTILKALAPGYQSWTSFNCTQVRPLNGSISDLLNNLLGKPTPLQPMPLPVVANDYNSTKQSVVVCPPQAHYDAGSLNCVNEDNEIVAPVSSSALPPIANGCPDGSSPDPSGLNCQVCYNDGYNEDMSPINQQCETVAPNPIARDTDCSAGNIQAAAASGDYTLTDSQAATLSCIAAAESSCGLDTRVAYTPDGKPTSASGMFQIVFGSGDDQCHNLNIDVCTQAARAAGFDVSGNLNCYSTVIRQGQRLGSPACRAAAANINCNASAAACLVQARGGRFTDWTADSRSSRQSQCIQQYGG